MSDASPQSTEEPGAAPDDTAAEDAPTDARIVTSYLTAPESDDYIAILSVLDAVGGELTPAQVAAELRTAGHSPDVAKVEARLGALRGWGVVSPRQDNNNARVVADLLAKNFRYTLTRHGRITHRFYREFLADGAPVREIAFNSLGVMIAALEALAAPDADWTDATWVRQRVDEVFTNHDNLDSSLVGSEDALLALAGRYDLDDPKISEFKDLLLGYTTRAVEEIEAGQLRVMAALRLLDGRFDDLAAITVSTSAAAALIHNDVLAPSKGGQAADWDRLVAWFDPARGRPARFSSRILTALPTLYANLRRRRNAAGALPDRSRALLLAQACLDETWGQALFVAALGDHPWRKLHGETDEPTAGRTPRWRDGPQVEVAKGLRTIGRTGTRGRAPAPPDDSADRAAAEQERARRKADHDAKVAEILDAGPGDVLSAGAGRLAFTRLLAARQSRPTAGRRTAAKDGLACTLVMREGAVAELTCSTFRAWVPGWVVAFHPPGQLPVLPAAEHDDGRPVRIVTQEVAA
ncbi:DUF2397 family protein [Puerhibacterium sp. TATVAM-FAB25]|uniref:DUF2397 family protein n=1 Tax=Puerhibacterium sp. TATVAM-FAB25 TaxID=3093699 RepID=UPI00397D498C